MNKEILVVTWGGIGDVLVCTPTLKAVKEKYPDFKLIVYCSRKYHPQVFKNNPYIDSVRLLKAKHMWRYPSHLYAYLFNRNRFKYYHLFFQHIPPSWIYKKTMKEIVPEIFTDLDIKLTDKKVQLFLTKAEEEKARVCISAYKSPILMHIHSTSSSNHHWPLERWEALVKSLPEFTFIQVGNVNERRVNGAVDLRGKTTVREVFALLKYAVSFVGVDSCFGHVTNAFNIPGVVLFSDSSPVYWGHENNINIYKDISCSPCYDYLSPFPCPYGHECMKEISVKEVRDAVLLQTSKINKKEKQRIQI